MNISLAGKIALVGGSTRGLGKAIALQLAASGAEVVLLARNEEKLEKVREELPVPSGQNHRILVADFSDFEKFKKVLTWFFETHSVDILVNNTQGPAPGGVLDKQPDDYQKAFDLLFQTVAFQTKLALIGMKEKGYGRILNLSSVSIKEPLPNLVLSNAVRSAVISWAKTLARAVAPDGITVNNLLTGFFDTERLRQIIEIQALASGISASDQAQKMVSEIPAGRLGKPEEFAQLVTFLASDAAAYITGTSIPIDGGLLRSV
jgi:3-oxoacyl-[acyl-carrier protein] reductase